ncbi:MAG: acyl-CoA dehydrogenase family protein [Actinomycetota bacterium]
MRFVQDGPVRQDRWETDRVLRNRVERLLPDEVLSEVGEWLADLGKRAVEEWAPLAEQAEANPPHLVRFDAWGNRIDQIVVDPAWTELVKRGQSIGIAAIPYEAEFGPASRIVQAAVVDLFGPVSATADCPLSMTDAAISVLRREDPELAERFGVPMLRREYGWTSGQWMTEQAGGSDVGRTGTEAIKHGDGTWTLHGTKWFTSATTADLALALARPEGAGEGSRALSLFAVPLRNPDGSWNGIAVRRLKDKMGTKALPTAELELDGAIAYPVGGIGDGVRKVGPMLNITRLHAALGSVSAVGEGLGLIRDYANRRQAFGRPLRDLPLHRRWIAGLAARYDALHALAYRGAQLLGQAETGGDPDGTARLVLPLAKLACARGGAELTSHIIESFGGAGYVNDTGIPRIHLDTHVNCIWEGTTSVIALDVLRVISRGGTGAALIADIRERVAPAVDDRTLGLQAAQVAEACDALEKMLVEPAEQDARRIAFGLANTLALALLVSEGLADLRSGDARTATAARIFSATPLIGSDHGVTNEDEARLAFDPR